MSEKSIRYLKGFLVIFDTLGILLIIWLFASGVVSDSVRGEDEGAEPTIVRMTRVCAENGIVMIPGNETLCGQIRTIDLDNETIDILAVRMEDMDEATFREKYQKSVENVDGGVIVVVLEDSEEMFKVLFIIGEDSYTLRAFYRGKKLQIDGMNLAAMEDALFQMGAPNRNRSDSERGAELVAAGINEWKNLRSLIRAQYFIERATSQGWLPAYFDYGTVEVEERTGRVIPPELVTDIDENHNSDVGDAYDLMVREQGDLTDYAGNKMYFAVAKEARPDLAVPGVLSSNQILIHYHATCEGGRVVASDGKGAFDRPFFAATYPKLDGSGYYCIRGNETGE